MATLRKQSIISSVIIFFGFIVGFLNNLFFGGEDGFTESEFGLTRSFYELGQVIFAFSFFGITAYIYKFTPYYKAQLKDKENDMLSWSLTIPTMGFIIFCFLGYFFKFYFVKKFGTNSPQLVDYYFWMFPFSYFLTLFNVLEVYLWTLQKTIFSNFLREVLLRIYISLLIVLFIFKVINYDSFIKLFTFSYGVLVFTIIGYLIYTKQFHLTFSISKVTKKFRKKILTFSIFVYAGICISILAASIDSITIASKLENAQAKLGVFAMCAYITNIITIAQRSVIAISLPALAEAWRIKNFGFISRIYKRTSINLLLISVVLFGALWLSLTDLVYFFELKKSLLDAKWVIFTLGIKIIIDMGTGVNGQIIGTSNFWRFEFLTGIILLLLILPLNYFLISNIGILGAAISSLIAFSIYNIIRVAFLWHKFKLQPFTIKTVYTLICGLCFYFITYYLFEHLNGFWAIFCRSVLYIGLMVAATYYLNLSQDANQVLETIQNRLRKIRKK